MKEIMKPIIVFSAIFVLVFILIVLGNQKQKEKNPHVQQTQTKKVVREFSTPKKVSSSIIRSEYARELMKKFTTIDTEDVKLFQQQAKEAWPDDHYYIIHNHIDTKDANYDGYIYIMVVGPHWVFTLSDPSKVIKEKVIKQAVATKENW